MTWRQDLHACTGADNLDHVKAKFLGKNGILTQKIQAMSTLNLEEKKRQGPAIMAEKKAFLAAWKEKKDQLVQDDLHKRLMAKACDVTLPVPLEGQGRSHPITQTLGEIRNIFRVMGFECHDTPNCEEVFYNFDALNVPSNHPSRSEQDTFYLKDSSQVLRTHTSPGQIRLMKKRTPPFRCIVPGRVYRRDYDQTHTPMFHQVEGLVVEPHCHMGHLKGCLETFFRHFFCRNDLDIRFRSSYFPFTEPSAEVDIRLEGKWLEVLGCGMVHPKV